MERGYDAQEEAATTFGLAKTMVQSYNTPSKRIERGYEAQEESATMFGLAKTMCRVTI